jgi:hypothetical protein
MEENTKKKRLPNPETKVALWTIADFTVVLSPLVIWGIIQRDVYFATGMGLSNGIGIAMLGGFIGLIIAKKTAFLKGVGGMIAITTILFCLRAIITDLVVISALATAGMGVSSAWTSRKKIKWVRIRDKTETAEINKVATESVVQGVIEIVQRSGRV